MNLIQFAQNIEMVTVTATVEQTTNTTSKVEEHFDAFLDGALDFSKNLFIALICLVIGLHVVKLITKMIKKAFAKANMDLTVARFLVSLINGTMKVLLFVTIAVFVGVPETTFLAVLGSAGLAIGLAFQGSLSNFAGGVLLLINRPFNVGDYIKENASGNEGTVKYIELFYTTIVTIDNKQITIPNGMLTNTSVVNFTREKIRRVDLVIPVAYSEDLIKVKAVIQEVIDKNSLILKEQEFTIALGELAASSLNFKVRVWTNTDKYWDLYFGLLEQIKLAFDANSITIPFNQLEVTVKNN